MIPSKLAARLPSIRETKALRFVAQWLETDIEFAVLVGDTGAGKSLAAAWAFAWQDHRAPVDGMGRRRSAVWWDAGALAALSPWAGEKRRPDEPTTGWAAYDIASLVVIDDAGTESAPERIAAAIERAFNVSTGRVLITTNLDRESFIGRLGDPTDGGRYGLRVKSRLADSRGWFTSAAPDMRITAPTTAPFRGPKDPTPREAKATADREAQLAAEEAEWEARSAEQAEMAARHMAELVARTTGRRSFDDAGRTIADRGPDDESDNERRRLFAAQVERARSGLLPVADLFLDIEREEQGG